MDDMSTDAVESIMQAIKALELGTESSAAALGGGGTDAQLWQQARTVVETTMSVHSMGEREYEWWILYTYQVPGCKNRSSVHLAVLLQTSMVQEAPTCPRRCPPPFSFPLENSNPLFSFHARLRCASTQVLSGHVCPDGT